MKPLVGFYDDRSVFCEFGLVLLHHVLAFFIEEILHVEKNNIALLVEDVSVFIVSDVNGGREIRRILEFFLDDLLGLFVDRRINMKSTVVNLVPGSLIRAVVLSLQVIDNCLDQEVVEVV